MADEIPRLRVLKTEESPPKTSTRRSLASSRKGPPTRSMTGVESRTRTEEVSELGDPRGGLQTERGGGNGSQS